jgi:hypothetical protein
MTASERIRSEVSSWPRVEEHSHRFGGWEFVVGRVELGHIHGDRFADLPFPKKVRDELVEANRARPHHVLPNSGWVTRDMHADSDVDDVISLFRLNYERVTKRRA